MKKRLAALGTALVAVLASLIIGMPQASAASGFHINNGRLYDANGNEFVMRGINHAHAWYPDQTQSIADIKATGANTVRVALGTGDQFRRTPAKEVADIVSQCKENRLICVLEVHDTTGYGEDGSAVSLSKAVDYWIDIKQALVGHEENVLINIGNEPFGNQGYQKWTSATTNAITRLREAGFEHALVADAPNWGQDHTNTMRDNAAKVFNSDPAKNTMFSVHMYGVYESASKVRDYLNSYVEAGLPIMIGEFGHKHSDGDPNEDAIMKTATSLGVGYFGWSWSGNTGGVEYLDIVRDFDPTQVTEWGNRLINGPNGIKETAEEASVY